MELAPSAEGARGAPWVRNTVTHLCEKIWFWSPYDLSMYANLPKFKFAFVLSFTPTNHVTDLQRPRNTCL